MVQVRSTIIVSMEVRDHTIFEGWHTIARIGKME
jgi:hypothetical protein